MRLWPFRIYSEWRARRALIGRRFVIKGVEHEIVACYRDCMFVRALTDEPLFTVRADAYPTIEGIGKP